MIVYKFGGASVKDVEGIKNLTEIVRASTVPLVVVISALGKTTNALEKVARIAAGEKGDADSIIDQIFIYHKSIIEELLPARSQSADLLADSVAWLHDFSALPGSTNFDFIYDQVVSLGEVWSTRIIEEWLSLNGLNCCWIDMREVLITDNRYRDANILWHETGVRLKGAVGSSGADICVVQGFIGGTLSGHSTTLGREGSDYTAGVVANIMDAGRVEIWKDVPGILNADPEWMKDARKLENISYKEAVEMSFSGAKVIHPKTIKPLQNKSIPLFVKSFLDPEQPGTIISTNKSSKESIPVFVKKEEQVLISLMPYDFSFVMGENLGKIFHLFYKHGIKTNLVQASAVSIAVCVDRDMERISNLTSALKDEFSVLYNDNVEMVSLRYYDQEAIRRVTEGKTVLLEQRTRKAIRFVIKSDIQG